MLASHIRQWGKIFGSSHSTVPNPSKKLIFVSKETSYACIMVLKGTINFAANIDIVMSTTQQDWRTQLKTVGLALYSGNNSASESRKKRNQNVKFKIKLRKNEDNIQKASTYENSMLSSIYFRSSHADFQYSKGTSSFTYCDYKYYISSWASSHLLHQCCHFHISGKPLGISPALNIPKISFNQSNCTYYVWKCVYIC